jgi:(E)-4-hydroxy-3-methylbut-2-enyl-diphosphate synthase
MGGGEPVVVQSMCATKTRDVEKTAASVRMLHAAGAGIIRIAADSDADVVALAEIRKLVPEANLSVDLQESYRLAATVAPHVDKIRYNPGHLYHHEAEKSAADKVAFIVAAARDHDCALRVGVNCGSVDPEAAAAHPDDSVAAMVASAVMHCEILDRLGFARFVVSLKDSDPRKVVEANRRFSALRPDIPLHLGVTEAGLPPGGIMKSRAAFEPLLSAGIGDTLRVSLTLPAESKHVEVTEGLRIVTDVKNGRFLAADYSPHGLNIISCPSCSRVENDRFVELAEKVRKMTEYAAEYPLTIAVMGCRVNGPGETDDADLGVWCGPTAVNLKRRGEKLGSYGYDEVLAILKQELDSILKQKGYVK